MAPSLLANRPARPPGKKKKRGRPKGKVSVDQVVDKLRTAKGAIDVALDRAEKYRRQNLESKKP